MVIIAISSLGTSLKYRMNRRRDREREKYIYLLQELAWRVYVYVYVQPTWLSGPAVLMMNSQTIFKSSTSQSLALSLVTSFHMNSKWNIQNGLIKILMWNCFSHVCFEFAVGPSLHESGCYRLGSLYILSNSNARLCLILWHFDSSKLFQLIFNYFIGKFSSETERNWFHKPNLYLCAYAYTQPTIFQLVSKIK